MRSEAVIHKREVRGDNRAGGQVLPHHGGEKGLRLVRHRVHEIVVLAILGIQTLVRDVAAQFAQIEPLLGKGAHELLEARIGDQTLGLCPQHGFVEQTSVFRGFGEFCIRPRVPEKMRKSVRDGERGIRSALARLREVKAVGGAQQRLIAREHRLRKSGACGHFAANELHEGLERFLAHRAQRGLCGESAEKPLSIGGGAFGSIHMIEQNTMRWRRPRRVTQRAGDLQPLDRHAAMALRRHRRIVIKEAAIGADEGHGQSQRAVFKGLARLEMDRRLKVTRLRQQIHPAARLAHIARNIGAGRLAGTKAHRDGLMRRDEAEVPHLTHGAATETHAIRAALLRPEATRIAKVRPGRRAEQRQLQCGITPLLGSHVFELRVGDRHHAVVACEEHRLALTVGFEARKQVRAGETLRHRSGGRFRTCHRLPQRGLCGIEIALDLHAGDIEQCRHFGETMRIAVGGHFVTNVEMRQLQQHAQVVLKLHPSEPPHRAATILRDVLPRCGHQRRAKLGDNRLALPGGDFGLLRRRHLAFLHEIKHPRPSVACFCMAQIKRQRRDVEVALGHAVVVAINAVLVDEGVDRVRRGGAGGRLVKNMHVRDAQLLQAGFFVDAALDLIHQLIPRELPHDFSGLVDLRQHIAAFLRLLEVIVTAGDDEVAIRQTRHAEQVAALQTEILDGPAAEFLACRIHMQQLASRGCRHPQRAIRILQGGKSLLHRGRWLQQRIERNALQHAARALLHLQNRFATVLADPEGVLARRLANHAVAKVQRVAAEIRQRCHARHRAAAVHDADLVRAAVHERERFPAIKHRQAVRLRAFGACDGFVLDNELLRRIKHRQPALVRIRDAAVRQSCRVIDAAVAGMLQHGDDFATPVDLDDLIVRREQIALLGIKRHGKAEDDKEGFHGLTTSLVSAASVIRAAFFTRGASLIMRSSLSRWLGPVIHRLAMAFPSPSRMGAPRQ